MALPLKDKNIVRRSIDNEITLKIFNSSSEKNMEVKASPKMNTPTKEVEKFSRAVRNLDDSMFSKPLTIKKNDESTPLKKKVLEQKKDALSKGNEIQVKLEKLGTKFEDLKNATMKSRQAFGSYKVSSFFFSKTKFIKEFGDNLLKVEESLKLMEQSLDKVLITGNEKSILETAVQDAKEGITVLNVPETGSLTPPASEMDKDEALTLDDTNESLNKKRKRSPSISPEIKSKRPSKKRTSNLAKQNSSLQQLPVAEKSETETNERIPEVAENEQSTEQSVATDKQDEEFEVSKIKEFTKKQGQYYYKVSWKGYDSEDDTLEPEDNLTDCEDALVFFFQLKILERLNATTPEELKAASLPTKPEIQNLMLAAFEKIIASMNYSEDENRVKDFFQSKTNKMRKSDDEVKIDIMKFISLKDPSTNLYNKLKANITNSIRFRELIVKREHQLAKLRSWERNINTICSDPCPVTVENNVDLSFPPMDFRYINSYLAGKNITIPNDPMVGCECKDCIPGQKSCCAEQMSSVFPYNRYGRLRISLGTPIYECNKMCKCSADCCNRIVQKGRKIALAIFRTENRRGWGVKALEYIKKDTFVSEYVGEVISSEEAESRGKQYDAQGCTYLFDLDYNKGELNPYTIDAAKYGNVSHFINHSCDPNLVVYNVWVDCLDPDLPRLALFAVADIKKGEELTFDYNSGSTKQMSAFLAEKMDENGCFVTTPVKSENTDSNISFPSPSRSKSSKNRNLITGKTECRCGAVNCRKYFF